LNAGYLELTDVVLAGGSGDMGYFTFFPGYASFFTPNYSNTYLLPTSTGSFGIRFRDNVLQTRTISQLTGSIKWYATTTTTTSTTSSSTTTLAPPALGNINVWFDASNSASLGNPSNGDPITDWNNIGNLPLITKMTQSNPVKKPLYNAANKYLEFDDTNDGMIQSGSYNFTGINQTIVVIEDCRSTVGTSKRTLQSTAGNCLISLNQYAGLSVFWNGNVISTTLSGTGKHIGVINIDISGNAIYYIDNVPNGASSGLVTWGGMALGAEGAAPAEPANTNLCEIIVYDRSLSPSEMNDLNIYAQTKWGTP
jgi:hypothetical protein